MSKTAQEQFDDLNRAFADLKQVLIGEFGKIMAVIERFICRFWPGLDKEKRD